MAKALASRVDMEEKQTSLTECVGKGLPALQRPYGSKR